MEASQPEESFLTVAEVAEILKLNQQTVRNWIDQGSLPALRVGRRVRIRRSDFERVIAEAELRRASGHATGPSADDFWGGELVGAAEPAGPHDSDARPHDSDAGASPATATAPDGNSTTGQPSPDGASPGDDRTDDDDDTAPTTEGGRAAVSALIDKPPHPQTQ